MYAEDQFIMLSALQHYAFCPRQCALIHVEQQWSENRFTAEGRLQHDRVDKPEHEMRDGIRYEYAVPLRSEKLGLSGKADVVEFHDGMPYPVEHKRGRPKPDECDHIQLCAQAICLEEMMVVKIREGSIFYGKPRRREVVELTADLRVKTENIADKVHQLIESGTTPPPEKDKKCRSCSLKDICLPSGKKNVSAYIKEMAE